MPKKTRCGSCVGCTAKECETCKYCMDKTKRGGTNTMRKCCLLRVCTNLKKKKGTTQKRKRNAGKKLSNTKKKGTQKRKQNAKTKSSNKKKKSDPNDNQIVGLIYYSNNDTTNQAAIAYDCEAIKLGKAISTLNFPNQAPDGYTPKQNPHQTKKHRSSQSLKPSAANQLIVPQSTNYRRYCGTEVIPIDLHNAVEQHGGLCEVVQGRLWQSVRRMMKLQASTSSGSVLHNIYVQYFGKDVLIIDGFIFHESNSSNGSNGSNGSTSDSGDMSGGNNSDGSDSGSTEFSETPIRESNIQEIKAKEYLPVNGEGNVWTFSQRTHKNVNFLTKPIDARTSLPLVLHSGRIQQFVY